MEARGVTYRTHNYVRTFSVYYERTDLPAFAVIVEPTGSKTVIASHAVTK